MFNRRSKSVLVTIFVLLLCCHAVRAPSSGDTSALRDLTRKRRSNLIEDEYSDPAEMLGASGSSVAFALLLLAGLAELS